MIVGYKLVFLFCFISFFFGLIVIEDSVMEIYDRARSLIIMVTRQSNRLYVAKLKLADQVCLMTNISNGGWLWHASRYGHLNFHSLK